MTPCTDASPILRSIFNKNSPILRQTLRWISSCYHRTCTKSSLSYIRLTDTRNLHIVFLCKNFWFTSLKEESGCQYFFLCFTSLKSSTSSCINYSSSCKSVQCQGSTPPSAALLNFAFSSLISDSADELSCNEKTSLPIHSCLFREKLAK